MTPDAIAPLFFLAAALLVLAGVVKLVRPRAAAQALLDAGLPGSRATARAGGAAEAVVGIWALAAPAAGGALALAVAYLAFAAFLGYVLRVHPDAGSCGCAGATAVPPSGLHLALNVIAGLAGIAFAVLGSVSLGVWLSELGWAAAPVLAGLGLAGWLSVIVVSEAPAAFRSWVPSEHDHDAEPHGHDHAVADRELAATGIVAGHASLWPGVKRGSG